MAAKRKVPNARMGRPTLFTPERREKILTALRVGNYRVIAARMGGIADATFYSWLETGKADRAAGKSSDFVDFLENVEIAEAQAEATLVAHLMKQARENPTANLGMLRVRFRERWGEPAARMEITGKDGGPVAISPVLANLPDAVLEERVRALEAELADDPAPRPKRPRLVSGDD